MLPEINVCRREATALRRQTLTDRRSPAIFFTSFLSLTSVQKSFLPFCDNPPPGNLIEKFARLRPFPIIHRLLAIAPPSISSPEFARVHPTSPEFTRVRSSLPFSFSCFRTFVIGLPLIKFAESEITRRISKTRKNECTNKCNLLRESLPAHPCCTRCNPPPRKRPTEGLLGFSSLRFLLFKIFSSFLL